MAPAVLFFSLFLLASNAGTALGDPTGLVVESLGPPARIAGWDGAWVRYEPALSVDCSPPRGCYAKTMRFHYDFRCSPWNAVLTEVIAMDLNGAIVKREVVQAPVSYVTAQDAFATRIFETFCGVVPERGS